MVLAEAARAWSIVLSEHGHVRLGDGIVKNARVRLAFPKTWMNLSGGVVRQLIDESGVRLSQLIVIHDDLDLELGRLRLKTRGGAGGHNGVQSVIEALGTEDFLRLKIGIGRPAPGQDSAEYVLSTFLPMEQPLIADVLPMAVGALECVILQGPEAAMNRYHGWIAGKG